MASGKAGKWAGGWSVGFAEADMTPPLGRLMSGYGRERYAQGVVAPLMAQALALRDAKGRAAVIVTADVLGFEFLTLDFLRRSLKASHRLDPAAVMIAPSHTHWGPGTQYRLNMYICPPNFYIIRELELKLLALATQALDTAAPATLTYIAGRARIGHNRRVIRPEGGVDFAVNLDGHYDEHTPILRARIERSGDSINEVVLVGHACHPTSTGGIDHWSPDYPGSLRDHLKAALGPKARGMFVMGCGADAKVTHRNPDDGKVVFSASVEHSAAAGKRLADAVLEHLGSGAGEALPASVRASRASSVFTLAKPPGEEACKKIAFDAKAAYHDSAWARQRLMFPGVHEPYVYEAVAWNLGDALTVFGLPDEVCSPVGPRTRAQARTPHAMTVGYANTVQCYIPSTQIVREGGYEGNSSHRSYFLPAPFTTKIDKEYTALIGKVLRGLGRK